MTDSSSQEKVRGHLRQYAEAPHRLDCGMHVRVFYFI